MAILMNLWLNTNHPGIQIGMDSMSLVCAGPNMLNERIAPDGTVIRFQPAPNTTSSQPLVNGYHDEDYLTDEDENQSTEEEEISNTISNHQDNPD